MLRMNGLVLIILMKFRKTICNRGWGLLFLFSKHYLKEITPLWCILLHAHTTHILHFIGWEVIHFCCKKTKQKNNQLHVYIFRENIIILTIYHSNNCDGPLYSQEIVRIQKVFNKEGWIVAN